MDQRWIRFQSDLFARAELVALAEHRNDLFAAELTLPLLEREIDRTEMYLADEAFFCGSAYEILPITSVDRYLLGDGSIGPVTRQIRRLYHDVVRGATPKYKHWLTPVY